MKTTLGIVLALLVFNCLEPAAGRRGYAYAPSYYEGQIKLMLALIVLPFSQATSSDSTQPLLLSPYIEKGKIDEARNKSEVTGLKCFVPKSHAGFITVDTSLGNHLFFWYFPSPTNPTAPLILWTNGGPGTTGMSGLFVQHGPMGVRFGDTKYYHREDTLVGPFSVVYVDSPVGVGYSYSDKGSKGIRKTKQGYGRDLAEFVRQFVELFPIYKTSDVYIGGQSYAGHYILSAGDIIDKDISSKKTEVNLKGIYLASPFIELDLVSKGVGDYSYAMGIISQKQLNDFKQNQTEYFKKSNRDLLINKTTAERFTDVYIFDKAGGAYNYADDSTVYFDEPLKNVMTSEQMRKSLHVGNLTFHPWNEDVYNALSADVLVSKRPELARLMNKYKVLIYNGNFDFVTNTNSIEEIILSTSWTGQKLYREAYRSPWKVHGQTKGHYSLTDKLCRVVIFGAGHDAGRYTPKLVLRMFEQFVHNGCCVSSHC